MRFVSSFVALACAGTILGSVACSSSSSGAGSGSGGSAATGGSGSGGSASGGALGSGGTTSVGSGGSVEASGGSGGQSAAGSSGQNAGSGGQASGGANAGGNGPGSGGNGGGALGGGGGASSSGGAGGTSGPAMLSVIASWPNGAIMTGVRGVTSPAVTQTVNVHNGTAAAVMITALSVSGANQAAFKINGMPALPAMLAAGANLPITVEAATTGSALPAAPSTQAQGATLLTASLMATASTVSASTNLFGVILPQAKYEATLGQILTTLGYKMNVGRAQNNAEPNSAGVEQLPKVEAGTDEIAAPLFKKLATGMPTLAPVGRMSPKGPMPFGWYPKGSPSMRNMVAAFGSTPDAQTSDKGRMVLPPVTGSTTFDPGATVFGIWVYSDQVSGKYESGGTASYGDYDYSEDAPNSPANVHRCKVYTLKDGAGVAVAGSYLVVFEEAANGDYQDFMFVLSNVAPAS